MTHFERPAAEGPGPRRERAVGAVAIVGAGQVGTMLGMALMADRSDAGVESVTLFDRDPAVAAQSLRRGAGNVVGEDIAEAFRADTIVLSLPVDQIVSQLDEFGPQIADGSLVIDTGSAKGVVVAAMRRSVPATAHAVGGHPMAGTERPGPAGADPERLLGATFVLTPVRDDPRAMERAAAFVSAVGARPVQMEAGEHDRAVAFTSHLPHLLAYSLSSSVPAPVVPATDTDLDALVSTGFLGASRLAESDPSATAAFLCANAPAVVDAAAAFGSSFDALLRLLDDQRALGAALASARARRRDLTGNADR